MEKIGYGGNARDEEEYKDDYMDYGGGFPSGNANNFGQDQPVMLKKSTQGGYGGSNAGRYGSNQPVMSKPSATRGFSTGKTSTGVSSKPGNAA